MEILTNQFTIKEELKLTHRLFIVYSACCLLLCACHNYQNKEEILIAIAEESVPELAVERFFLEHINRNWRPKIHHSLGYCENDSYYTVLAITTGWNRVLSLRFRFDPYRDEEISYEGYTVSQFVDIKEAKKFSSYSEFKRRYGPAAYSYINDDNCTAYVYMQKWINFELRHFGSTGIESRIVKVRVDTDTDTILSVDEEYVMNM